MPVSRAQQRCRLVGVGQSRIDTARRHAVQATQRGDRHAIELRRVNHGHHVDPRRVDSYGFGAFDKGPPDKADGMIALHKDLEAEVMKDAGAVLFEKKAWTKFDGDLDKPQEVCVDAYVALWNAIAERVKAKAPVLPELK